MMRSKRGQRGFTLMELMVVIVIVAILAAVAVPLYLNYVKDAQRTEAKGAIGALITAEQVYYQLNNAYTQDRTKLNVDLIDVESRGWVFTFPAPTTNGFTIKASKGSGADLLEVTYTYVRGTGTTPGTSTWE